MDELEYVIHVCPATVCTKRIATAKTAAARSAPVVMQHLQYRSRFANDPGTRRDPHAVAMRCGNIDKQMTNVRRRACMFQECSNSFLFLWKDVW